MAIAFGDAAAAIEAARGLGFASPSRSSAWARSGVRPPSEDASIRQELGETLYHVLWELVHVFFDHRGLLEGREAQQRLRRRRVELPVPFLSEQSDLGAVVDDVRRSVLAKAREVGELRAQTLGENAAVLGAAAESLRASLNGGGRLLALGNGGSATDAMDVVADFRSPPDPRWTRGRRST